MGDVNVKYPIGIQSFSELREGGYIYVDKTAWIYKLISQGKYYFLSRPRRFGKSLLLSTMKAFFEGRKDLFEDLAISESVRDWQSYPVITLSFAGYRSKDDNIETLLDNRWKELEEEYGRLYDINDLSERFRNIIRAAYQKTGKKVVVLIDEYDAPLVAQLSDSEEQVDRMRELLKSVYVHLKDLDAMLEFVMFTGISRFSKMTVFSGLNNLRDISLLSEWSEICGITETELRTNFRRGIEDMAEAQDTDYNGALRLLKENYDGYHFAPRSADIYNPYSVLNALADSDIAPYWFRTGTPTFLIKGLRKGGAKWSEVFNERVSESVLSDNETYRTTPIALLFQTGYLTIKDYDRKRRLYRLGIPNKEVKSGLFSELLSFATSYDKNQLDKRLWDIRDAFEEGNPEEALEIIRSFLAGIPANLTTHRPEIYYENNLFLLFKLIGLDARTEWWTSDGRIDILLQIDNYVYIMELKLDKTPDEALCQINTKDYALQWQHTGLTIFKIGISFSSASRNITSWLIEVG